VKSLYAGGADRSSDVGALSEGSSTSSVSLDLRLSPALVNRDNHRVLKDKCTPPNGLAIIAPNDHFAGTVEDMHYVAKSVNATTATIDDADHWWMCSHPEQAASILIEHWERFGK